MSFRSLDFQDADKQHITIKIDGLAQSVNSIALQAQLFSKNGVITSPIFGGIAREADGVRFTLTALVNPASINYSHALAGAAAAAAATQAPLPLKPATTPFGGSAPTE